MKLLFVLLVFLLSLSAKEYTDLSGSDVLPLHESYQYAEDARGTWTIKAVQTPQIQQKFHPLDGRSAGFGLTRSEYWIKIAVENPKPYPIKRLLKFDYPLLDRVEFYRMSSGGGYRAQISGDSVAVEEHEKRDENIVFGVEMEPYAREILYFHIRSHSSMDLQLYGMNEDQYYTSEISKTALLGIFYGSAMIMILYNFFLYLSIRERSYLYYVVFQIVNVLNLLALSGIALRYLWPDYPQINNTIIPFLIVSAHVMAIIFTRTFLDTRTLLPKLDKVLSAVLFFSLTVLILTAVLDYFEGLVLAVVVLFVTTLSLISVGLIAYFRYNVRASKFYLSAWFLLIIGTTLTGMKNIGLLPINFLTIWATHIGVFCELLLLSFGLADRINVIRLQKERFQDEAAQKAKVLTSLLQKSKEELEKEVKERTFELYMANLELRKNITAKEALFKEVHHRVKNNLQVIISMMSLQRRRTHEEAVHRLVDDSTARLQSMAVIHEMLYQSSDIMMIRLDEYLHSLVDLCRRNSFGESVGIDTVFEPIEITMDMAVAMGLICNEVLSNVFKHAFRTNETGNRLSIRCEERDKRIILRIKDNGIGFDGFAQNKKCIGVMLVNSLAEKLPEARIVYKKWNGTYFRLEFSNEPDFFDR